MMIHCALSAQSIQKFAKEDPVLVKYIFFEYDLVITHNDEKKSKYTSSGLNVLMLQLSLNYVYFNIRFFYILLFV